MSKVLLNFVIDLDKDSLNCNCIRNYDLIDYFNSELDEDFEVAVDVLNSEIRDSAFVFCEKFKCFLVRNNVKLSDLMKGGSSNGKNRNFKE